MTRRLLGSVHGQWEWDLAHAAAHFSAGQKLLIMKYNNHIHYIYILVELQFTKLIV